MSGGNGTRLDLELGRRLREGLERAPAPEPLPLDRVARRARTLRLRRHAVAAAVALAVVAGVAVPLGTLLRLGPAGRVTGVPGAGPQGPTATAPPSVLEVVCDGSSTTVVNARVKLLPDGVHLRVDNRSGGPLSVSVRAGGRGLFGVRVPAGVSEPEPSQGGGWPVPPGVASVGCFPRGQDQGDTSAYAAFEVVDPEGLWVPWDLQCRGTAVTAAIDQAEPQGVPGDPVEVAREALAPYVGKLGPADTLERAGLPEQVPVVVRLSRDGRTVATVELWPDEEGGGWVVSTVSVCEEAQAG
ncbi:MAG TPA: hypothetical protein VNO79_00270 [Actinomycetota bacterium]|nr:hypothetical protein [Actinomycetota bacterium]